MELKELFTTPHGVWAVVASAELRRGGKHYLLGFNTAGRFEIPACIQGGRFTFTRIHDLPRPMNLIAVAGEVYAHRVASASAKVGTRDGHPALMLFSAWGEAVVRSLGKEKVVLSLSGGDWELFLSLYVEGHEEANSSSCVISKRGKGTYRFHSWAVSIPA